MPGIVATAANEIKYASELAIHIFRQGLWRQRPCSREARFEQFILAKDGTRILDFRLDRSRASHCLPEPSRSGPVLVCHPERGLVAERANRNRGACPERSPGDLYINRDRKSTRLNSSHLGISY